MRWLANGEFGSNEFTVRTCIRTFTVSKRGRTQICTVFKVGLGTSYEHGSRYCRYGTRTRSR
eukprot:scaffold228012_cov22-Prasinocladus_malaysianus.AAC.1